jgi:response regulator RpfG family c-di-GMP phosphodiesterase
MSSTPQMPQLDAALEPFSLSSADAGDQIRLDQLVTAGPAVLALVDGGKVDDSRVAMLRELGQRMRDMPARLIVVSAGESPVGRQLAACRAAEWLTDPTGEAARVFGIIDTRKLRRDRRRDALFVVDTGLVLRLAFVAQEADQWIPASFVASRLERLGVVAKPPPRDIVEQGVPGEAELDALVRAVGGQLGLTPNEQTQLATASRFRDLGMTVVPDEIITKAGSLDDQEWEIVRKHPERSADMLGPSPLFEHVRAIVRASHEHLDGSGYPNGLGGEDIPLGARILLACEAYLAMVFGRGYHDPERTIDPLDELRADTGTRYDPAVIDALAAVLAEEPGTPELGDLAA